VKIHAGLQGNEMADRLAKKDDIAEVVYDKIPRETIITEGKENEMAGAVDKLYKRSSK